MIQAIDVCVNPFFPEFKDKYTRFGYWNFLGGSMQRQGSRRLESRRSSPFDERG